MEQPCTAVCPLPRKSPAVLDRFEKTPLLREEFYFPQNNVLWGFLKYRKIWRRKQKWSIIYHLENLDKVENKSTEKYLEHYFIFCSLKIKLLVEMEAVVFSGSQIMEGLEYRAPRI